MEEYLIKNTTREQREQIVKDSLGYSAMMPWTGMICICLILRESRNFVRSRWNIRRSMCVIWSARSAGAAICTRNGAIFPSRNIKI